MVATKMFLGTAATLIASSTAFVAPMVVRSVAPAFSSSLSMQDAVPAQSDAVSAPSDAVPAQSDAVSVQSDAVPAQSDAVPAQSDAVPAQSDAVPTQDAGTAYVKTLPGAPFSNGKIFDPLEFSVAAAPADIKKWREAEIKHGRVSMLACVGVVVAEKFHPLFMGNADIGPAVNHFQQITEQYPEFWVFSLLGMALVEYRSITTAFAEPDPITGEGDLREDYIPGNLGFDPLKIKPRNPAALKSMETKELNNGRLAMIGIAGMLVQELVNPVNIFS